MEIALKCLLLTLVHEVFARLGMGIHLSDLMKLVFLCRHVRGSAYSFVQRVKCVLHR